MRGDGLPRLVTRRRRALLAGVALVGLGFVGVALGSATLVGALVAGTGGPAVVGVLVGTAVLLGLATHAERVLG